MLDTATRLLVILIDEHHYAVPLLAVSKVVHAVEVTPLPGAPASILGVFNHRGTVIPLLNLRAQLAVPSRPITLSDRFVIVTVKDQTLALLVDDVRGLIERPVQELASMNKTTVQLGHASNAVHTHDGLVLVYDLGQALSQEEWSTLNTAVARNPIG